VKHELVNIESCPICKGKESEQYISAKDHNVSKHIFNIVFCEACGFRYTNPKPSEKTIGKYYQSKNYISHTSSKKGLFNFIYHRVRNYQLNKKERLISTFNKSHSKELLDFGSGTGEFLSFCSNRGWKTTGVEPEKKAADLAVKNHNLNMKTVSGFFESNTEKYDVITLWHVLEHVYDLEKYLIQIHRNIKKGGILVLGLPNSNSYDAIHYKENWVAWDLPIHLYHFTKNDIKRIAKNIGFELIKVKPLIFDSFYISMLSEQKKGRSKLFGIFRGLVSNLKAKKTKEYSSHIYILKK
jgi:2-polyprenyl-3-methyl-5-hydroxy-6-metoxy-1,4-benzoquinol methylase